MTVKELRDLLVEYSDDTPITIADGRFLKEIEVAWVIDQDSNKGSVCLLPKQEPSQFMA